MMKLVVVVLILCIAPLANAGLIFTVDGQAQPAEIELELQDEVQLGLELGAGENMASYTIDYALNNNFAELVVDSEIIEFPAPFILPGEPVVFDAQHVQIAASNLMGAVNGPVVLMSGLILRCLDPTPVDLTITAGADTVLDGEVIAPGTILHTLHIEQVPEPATVLLLGFGAIFLRRRK